MSEEQALPCPHTTRFLFPQPQQAVHTVFESKRQQGLPGVKEKSRQACLPPLRAGPRGLLVAPDTKPGSSLACYKHYDVHLDWSEVSCSAGSSCLGSACFCQGSRNLFVRTFTPLQNDSPNSAIYHLPMIWHLIGELDNYCPKTQSFSCCVD